MKQHCSRCDKWKSPKDFAPNTWCKQCMSEYRKARRKIYKNYIRPEFHATILTDAEMKKELARYRPPKIRGLNAREEFSKQFKRALKIKTFDSRKLRRLPVDQVVGFKLNNF